MDSAGKRFRLALAKESPLQCIGTINAFSAILAEQSGFKSLYLSGAGVANASLGVPDLGITTHLDVAEDIRRITGATELPLLADIDTGWGSAFNIERSIKDIEKAGAAAVHIEDQVQAKRCGHRPNKSIVPKEEMIDRITAAVQAKSDSDFVIMARTDALANEGMESAIERSLAYVDAGADMIFPEAMQTLDQYQTFVESVKVPVLANITEFGKTPLFTTAELSTAGVQIALYPLSAFRAMSKAALEVFASIRNEGTQKSILNKMQTREELYDVLDYYSYEHKLDELFGEQ